MKDYSVVPIEKIKPYEQNARHHSKKQIKQIAQSIQQFSFINPIIIDKNGSIIAGHGRYFAAIELELKSIPIIEVDHLTENEIRAYRLADNKIAENSDWDDDLLQIELSYLLEIDTHFDVDITGFSTGEIDVLVSDIDPDQLDEPPPLLPNENEIVSRSGDIWCMNKHRLGVGDCRDQSFIVRVMCGKFAVMGINDPPYNVAIDGHVCGKGQVHHPEFSMASGEMSIEEFTQFLITVLTMIHFISKEGSLHYFFMDWRHLSELLTAGNEVFDQFINLCVWSKTNAGMGSFYRSQHELCLIFKKGSTPHINNVNLGKDGRNRSNVWNYAGMNSFGADRDEMLAAHPTVKPVTMIADAIMDVTQHGDIVFDGFLGSGTTLLAAECTHRICYGIEIDPRYVDVSLRRWMADTGDMPILEGTDLTFDEVAEERLDSTPKPEVSDE